MTYLQLAACACQQKELVCEKLTFNQMVGVSEQKRKERARGVTGPPVDVEAYNGVLYYVFNFKSLEFTTGKRHKGYIRFYKPKNPKLSLGKVECDVDCTCPDFKYTWAWAIKQRGSTTVGSNSLNGCLNKAPRKKNPRSVPGLCKHLLSLTKFIMNQMSAFPGTDPDDSTKIAKLIKRNNNKFSTSKPLQNKERASSDALKNRASAQAAGVPYQVPPPLKKSETEIGEVTDNANPTNPTNEALFKNMETTLPILAKLLEAEEQELQKEEKPDGLQLLTSIRDLISDVKELLVKEEEPVEEEEEDVDLEKEAEAAPMPPALKDSENPESKDKEV